MIPQKLESQENLILSRIKSRILVTDGEVEALPSRSMMS